MPNHALASDYQPGFWSRLISMIDRFTCFSGYMCAALMPVMVVVMFSVVVMRYGFDTGSIALQESITYIHAWIFLVGMAYTLKADGHVRVDIFYRTFSTAQKAWVNAIGGLVFLLPLCVILLITTIDYAARSWAIGEVSAEGDGIAFVYGLKSFLPLASGLLLLQCLTEVLANTLTLIDRDCGRSEV